MGFRFFLARGLHPKLLEVSKNFHVCEGRLVASVSTDQRSFGSSPIGTSGDPSEPFPTMRTSFWAAAFLQLLPVFATQCKRGTPGLSLLAHKSSVQKSLVSQFPEDISFPSYASPWCPCGGYPEYCGLLQQSEERKSKSHGRNYNQTLQCHDEHCGESYPASPYSCTAVGGDCVTGLAGNCLYASQVVNTSDGCGSRECFCARVAPGECIPENFPGYTIVQNGAYNVTHGKFWYPTRNGSTYEYPPDHRGWELVGGPGNHACRGDNSSDNDPKHYEVHNWIKSLWGCQNYCERTDGCTGVEYSPGGFGNLKK